jgi:hypothetical protein
MKIGFNDRYLFEDVVLGIFLILKGHHLEFCQKHFDATQTKITSNVWKNW